jgi:hypothetical protein
MIFAFFLLVVDGCVNYVVLFQQVNREHVYTAITYAVLIF